MVDYRTTCIVLQHIQAYPNIIFDTLRSAVSKITGKDFPTSSLYAILRVLLQEGTILKNDKTHAYRAVTLRRSFLLETKESDPGVFDLHMNTITSKQSHVHFDLAEGKLTHKCDEFVRKAKVNKFCDHIVWMLTSEELKAVLPQHFRDVLFKDLRKFVLDAQPENDEKPIDTRV